MGRQRKRPIEPDEIRFFTPEEVGEPGCEAVIESEATGYNDDIWAKKVNLSDYVLAVDEDGLLGEKGAKVLEHRLVMTREMGRQLDADEAVHHVNGDKSDNRIENLVVMSSRAHSLLHGYMKTIETLEEILDESLPRNSEQRKKFNAIRKSWKRRGLA